MLKSNVCILILKYTKLKIDYASWEITVKRVSKFLIEYIADGEGRHHWNSKKNDHAYQPLIWSLFEF